MSQLISKATGDFLTAATFGLVDTTSFLDSEAANTALTTSYVESQGFTPGAIEVAGIAIKLASRATGSPSNTISVRIAQGGSLVAGTEVTIDVADLPACSTADNEGGWIFFKFSSPVTLLAATAYTISAKLSATSTAVNLYRDATAGNWSRMLRTTTAQAPVAGDVMHIIGEHTGSGTGNSFVVTMNETAATDYGLGTDGTVAMTYGKRGTLQYGVAAATTYQLKLSGNLIGYSGGTFIKRTAATPRGTITGLEFDPVADGGMGHTVRNGATFTDVGLSRTSGKDVYVCKLNTDEAANSLSLGVDTDTGWLDNDVIEVAKTIRSSGVQTERGALNGNASSTDLIVDGFAGGGGGILNAHSGTAPTAAHVANFTRYSYMRSSSSGIMTYLNIKATAIVDIQWCEFQYLGENATGKRGIEIETTTGSCTIRYCSMRDFEDQGMVITGATTNNITYSDNVHSAINSAATTTSPFVVNATTGTTGIVFDRNYFFRCRTGNNQQSLLLMSDVGFTCTNNVFIDTLDGGAITFNEGNGTIGNFSGNVVYSSGSTSPSLQPYQTGVNGIVGTFTSYRNNGPGIGLVNPLSNTSAGQTSHGMVFNTPILFGNNTNNITIGNGVANIIFNDLVSNGDSTYATTNGVSLSNGVSAVDVIFNNADFSSTTGIKVAHTNDFVVGTNVYAKITLMNSKMGAATEVSNNTGLTKGSYIRSHKHDQVAGSSKVWQAGGLIVDEATNRHTAAGKAWKLTPASASVKLNFPNSGFETFKAAVSASTLVTITARILKNAAYNGNQPRLIINGAIVGGVPSDVITSRAGATKNITDATNASPIVITSAAHGYNNGDRILIEGVGGNTAANGIWTVANKTTNDYELAGSTGNGAYTSGGTSNIYELVTVTCTPNEDGVLEFYVDADGTLGDAYVDDINVAQ